MPAREPSRAHAAPALSVVALVAALLAACDGGAPSLTAGPPQPDVYLIVVDTLRLDALSVWNERMPIGDAVASLARDGIVLERLRAPSSWTRTSVASLLTGLTPMQHRVLDRFDTLAEEHATLAERLAAHGYRALAWSTNPQILPVWGFGRGFTEFEDVRPATPRDPPPEGIDVVADVVRTVEASPEGGHLYYVHLLDPHQPYVPPPADLERVRARRTELIESFPRPLAGPKAREVFDDVYLRYLAEVQDVDRALGDLFDFLRESGRYEDALIVVVADHGEEFLDHRFLGHGATLFEEQLRVPGLIKLPGNGRAGERIAADVELHDVVPTIAAVLGIDLPSRLPGRNLLAPDARPEEQRPPGFHMLVTDGRVLAALRDGNYKLIRNYRNDRVWLYDLAADPKERTDLSAERPEEVARLKALLDQTQAAHAPGWHLRACGCATPAELRFGLSTPSAGERRGLEAADVVASREPEGFRVEFDLTPQVEDPPTRSPLALADQDELILPADSPPPVLTADPDAPMLYALGNGEPMALDGSLDLSEHLELAQTPASEVVVCHHDPKAFWNKGRLCRPHLRIWSSRGPDAMAPEHIDPELRERLRALGYEF